MTERLSGTVTEIWCLKYWTHRCGYRKTDGRKEKERERERRGKRKKRERESER